MVMRLFKLVVGWVMVVFGIAIAPLPLPVGQAIALSGLALLILESQAIRSWVARQRRRFPRLGQQLARGERHLPEFIGRSISLTDPDGGVS